MKLAPARLVALALMLCFGAVFGIAKEPEPDAAAVKKEQDYIKQVYATDYKRLPADGRSFCEKLVNAAKEEKNPTRKYALLLEAASAALGDCDCDLAMTTVDARAKDFEINSLKARSDLLKGLSENMAVVGKDLDFRRSLFIHAIETSQRAVAEDALEVADDAASAAQIFARAITQNIRKDAMEGMEKQGIAKKILEAVKKRKSHQLTFKKD